MNHKEDFLSSCFITVDIIFKIFYCIKTWMKKRSNLFCTEVSALEVGSRLCVKTRQSKWVPAKVVWHHTYPSYSNPINYGIFPLFWHFNLMQYLYLNDFVKVYNGVSIYTISNCFKKWEENTQTCTHTWILIENTCIPWIYYIWKYICVCIHIY
jgi:hypothetical protein